MGGKKIFIAGCARSGTTLMLRMMHCFRDVYVRSPLNPDHVYKDGESRHEAPVRTFADISTDLPNIAIKRTSGCWKRLADLPEDIELIYCVRHPFDTFASRHESVPGDGFYLSVERWVSEFDSYLRLREKQPGRRIFIARYEDLTTAPAAFADRLAAHLGVEIAHPFDQHPYGIRISTDSVRKWETDDSFSRRIEQTAGTIKARVQQFADEFGYPTVYSTAES